MIEIVPDRADQAVAVSRNSFQGAPEQRVGFARAVNIGGQKSADPLFVSEMNEIDEAFIRERFTEVHEAPAAPHSKSSPGQLHEL